MIIRDVPEPTWAKLGRSVHNANNHFQAGDEVLLIPGGIVQEIGSDAVLGTLFQYAYPNGYAAGTECPDAFVFIDRSVVQDWPESGTVIPNKLQEIARIEDATRRILNQANLIQK
jgi:hypothetical protein